MTVHEMRNKGMYVRFNYKLYMAIRNGSGDGRFYFLVDSFFSIHLNFVY